MPQHPTIAIIGGGPGGLTLARILATRGIASTVFERDDHPLARPQGGSLDPHAEFGQFSLRKAGLEGPFNTLAHYRDQGGAIYDQHGTLHFVEPHGLDADRQEIDRTQLRALLIDSLPKETIRWGSKISGIVPLDDGRHRVLAEKQLLGDFDLVVGADGAWSNVRPVVSCATPIYTGVLAYELMIEDIDARHPALAALLPNGKIGAIGKSRDFIAQRSSNGHVRICLMIRLPEEWLPDGPVELASPAQARADLKALLPGWPPSLHAFVDACEDTIVARPIVSLPTDHRWPHHPGVTLIGDAAHVMASFGGEGVNLAMLDAAELAEAIATGINRDSAIAAFEARMLERAGAASAGALDGLPGFVSEDALAHALEHFSLMAEADVAAAL